MICAAASIGNPDYVPQNYHVFLVAIFLMVIHTAMSAAPTSWLAKSNSFGSSFNFLALIVVICILAAVSTRPSQGLPKYNSSHAVWTEIYDGMEFPAGIRILASFVSVIWTMSGYDAPFHLAEECSNANVASPRAIVLTAGLGGIFGWFLQIVTAYTVVDIDAVLVWIPSTGTRNVS
jgi:amino acid transporter